MDDVELISKWLVMVSFGLQYHIIHIYMGLLGFTSIHYDYD